MENKNINFNQQMQKTYDDLYKVKKDIIKTRNSIMGTTAFMIGFIITYLVTLFLLINK